jgi:hypothetical protein
MAVSLWKGKRPSVRVAPIFWGLEGIGRAAQKLVAEAREEDPEFDECAVTELLKSLGVLAGVPAVRPARAAQFLVDVHQGEVEEDDPAHILSGLIFGQTEGQGLNPITWAVE